MATSEAYEWFRICALLILIIHFVGLVPQWPRYVGAGFDDHSVLRRRITSYAALLLALTGLLISLFTQVALALIPALILTWYVHIDRRFESLARGAGAVGYIPYFTLAYLMTVGFVNNYVPQPTQAFRVVTTAYTLTWAAILLNSGIVKTQEGYLVGKGIRSFLTNPHWSRWWKWFQDNGLPSKLIMFLGVSGVSAEVLGGALLVIPQLAWVGATLIGVMFLAIGVFLKLYTLPWLSLASAAFIAICSFNRPNNESFFSNDWSFIRIVPVTLLICLFCIFFPLAQFLGLILFTTPIRHRLTDSSLLARTLKALCAFRWRVFTQQVINTYVGLSLTSHLDREGDLASMRSSYQLSCQTIPTFRIATESVAVVSVFNTLKSETYFSKFFDRLSRYNQCHNLNHSHEWVVWVCIESKAESQWSPVLAVSCGRYAHPKILNCRLQLNSLCEPAVTLFEKYQEDGQTLQPGRLHGNTSSRDSYKPGLLHYR